MGCGQRDEGKRAHRGVPRFAAEVARCGRTTSDWIGTGSGRGGLAATASAASAPNRNRGTGSGWDGWVAGSGARVSVLTVGLPGRGGSSQVRQDRAGLDRHWPGAGWNCCDRLGSKWAEPKRGKDLTWGGRGVGNGAGVGVLNAGLLGLRRKQPDVARLRRVGPAHWIGAGWNCCDREGSARAEPKRGERFGLRWKGCGQWGGGRRAQRGAPRVAAEATRCGKTAPGRTGTLDRGGVELLRSGRQRASRTETGGKIWLEVEGVWAMGRG